MGLEIANGFKPHEDARQGIDRWRGRCLDLFAKGERAIGSTLEAIRHLQNVADLKLRHFASHRADDLAHHLPSCNLTAKQLGTAVGSLRAWRELDERRNFLAHGIVSTALDPDGRWFAVFDMTVYRAGEAQSLRWTISESEASHFAEDVKIRFLKLNSALALPRNKTNGDADGGAAIAENAGS